MVTRLQQVRAFFFPTDGRMRRGAWGVVVLAATLLGVVVSLSNIVQRMDWAIYDRFVVTASATSSQPEDVVVVAIDEPSFQQIGLPWPWPRSLHASLLHALSAAGARRVVLDLVFDVPSNQYDDEDFAQALSGTVPVVLAGDVQYSASEGYVHQQAILPWDGFLKADVDVGMASMFFDPDSVIRRARLSVAGYPTLAFATYLADGRKNAALSTVLDRLPRSPLIRFYGPPQLGIRTVSYYQALAPGQFLPPGLFEGSTVFVGLSLGADAGIGQSTDQYTTPVGPNTPGVELQATSFANLVENEYVRDPFGSPWVAALAATLLALLFAAALRRMSVWVSFLLLSGMYMVIVLGGFLFLRLANTRLPVVQPAVVVTTLFAVVVIYRYTLGAIERRFILGAFKHYLAPAVVDEILEDPGRLSLGGSTRDVTVLFSDIAGFTTVSERLPPAQLTDILRYYFEAMMDVLLSYNATLDKFIGDAIMVFFGCPVDQPDHPARAIAAARDMQRASLSVDRANEARGFPPLKTRIGVNSGAVVAGNMGTADVFNYTVVGDTVNLASRLEGINKIYGTNAIASAATVERLETRAGIRLLDFVRVKGKSEPIEIFEIMPSDPGGSPGRAALINAYEQALRAYQSGRWELAANQFAEIVDGFSDPPSGEMLRRIRSYRQVPPPNWDGVHISTEK